MKEHSVSVSTRNIYPSWKRNWIISRHTLVRGLVLHGVCVFTLTRAVEALTRAGRYDPALLHRARAMFEVSTSSSRIRSPPALIAIPFLGFPAVHNHLGLCTEEIGQAGEGMGNAVQGFTHVTLISAAYNLSRTISQLRD